MIPTVPTVPTTPVVGGLEQQTAQQKMRKSAMDLRQETLQKLAESNKPIFRNVLYKTIQQGSLVSFSYSFWK